MGLLDNYTGIGMSPRPKWQHQLAMNRMYGNSFREINRQGLIILTEATVTDDWDDLAPDLVIFDSEYIPLSIIEVTTTAQLKAIIRKCDELIDRFPDAEYFVYNYETQTLYKYSPESDIWLSSNEYELYSRYLQEPVINYFMIKK